MGLFEKKKKDAERCPICGKEISFFSGLVIADGRICDWGIWRLFRKL